MKCEMIETIKNKIIEYYDISKKEKGKEKDEHAISFFDGYLFACDDISDVILNLERGKPP